MRIGERLDIAAQLGHHRGDLVLRGRHEVGGVDLAFGGGAHAGERDLKLVVVPGDLPLHLDVAAFRASFDDVRELLPHAGFELARLVCQREREVLSAPAFAVAKAYRCQAEEGGDDLVLKARRVGNKEVFHRWPQHTTRAPETGALCWKEAQKALLWLR